MTKRSSRIEEYLSRGTKLLGAFLLNNSIKPSLRALSACRIRVSKRRDATQGIKNDARGGEDRQRGTSVFDELFDPDGLRIAYKTIAAHARTHIYVHWMLDPFRAQVRCTRARTTNATRAYERMSAITPARSLGGQSVGSLLRTRLAKLRRYKSASARSSLGCQNALPHPAGSYEQPFEACGGTTSLILQQYGNGQGKCSGDSERNVLSYREIFFKSCLE